MDGGSSARGAGAGVRVVAGARLHFGFQNLSLAHERLYGGVGVALEEPRLVVEARPAETLECPDAAARPHARHALERLGLPGARVEVPERLPRHAGLGSGTQLALATYVAVARAHGGRPASTDGSDSAEGSDATDGPGRPDSPDLRAVAPALGRGGRSGVGVAAFRRGGFVVDGGHPTERFTTTRPADGEWTVPPVVARHALPADWRFVVVVPDLDRGRSGDREDESIRSVVERADGAIADEIATLLVRRLLPAAAAGDRETFGASVATLGRLNGAWYADEQGGVFRPPLGTLVDELGSAAAVSGAGQSSWGPAVYGLTAADRAPAARTAARAALDAAGVDGDVLVTAPRNRPAEVVRQQEVSK